MKKKFTIFFLGCLAVSVIFARDIWAEYSLWFSPQGLRQYGLFHWGVLGLCILWIWLKRKQVLASMKVNGANTLFVINGIVLLTLAVLLPLSGYFTVLLMLAGWVGVFSIIFGKASFIPTILLTIYVFSLTFPLLMNEWAGKSSALLVTDTVTSVTRIIGLPVISEGNIIRFTSMQGDAVATTITEGCAGFATIGVFLALFALMTLDIRLPFKRIWYIFFIGLAGTWFQNLLRVTLSIWSGYQNGYSVMGKLHNDLAYIIFPLWFALFAFIYFKHLENNRLPSFMRNETVSG